MNEIFSHTLNGSETFSLVVRIIRISRQDRLSLIPYYGMSVWDKDDGQIWHYLTEWLPYIDGESITFKELSEISERHHFINLNEGKLFRKSLWIWYEVIADAINIHKDYLKLINALGESDKIKVLTKIEGSIN